MRVDHSIFVEGARRRASRPVCYMFASWFEGALEYVAKAAGRPVTVRGREVYCMVQGQHDHCLFEVEPEA